MLTLKLIYIMQIKMDQTDSNCFCHASYLALSFAVDGLVLSNAIFTSSVVTGSMRKDEIATSIFVP